jgi:hypothetical protein
MGWTKHLYGVGWSLARSPIACHDAGMKRLTQIIAGLLLACSSKTITPEDPQNPNATPSNGAVVSKHGEFYDLFDVPSDHPSRNHVGLLLWSGVPIEDDDGNLKPNDPITAGDFSLWMFAATNTAVPSINGSFIDAALAHAKQLQLFASDVSGATQITDEQARTAIQKLSGKSIEAATKSAKEKPTRIEACRLLVEVLKPEALENNFTPDRADATLMLRSGKYWDSYWDHTLKLSSPMQPGPKASTSGKHKGVTVESLKPPEPGRYGTEEFRKSVKYLKSLGVNSIAIIPYARLIRYDVPSIIFDTGAGYNRASILKGVQIAKEEGMRVIVKPHLWMASRPENKGKWTGLVAYDDEGWQEYLARTRNMVMTLASIASKGGADVVVIGTETKTTSKKHADFMKKLIAEVRVIYGGELTYAANWDEFGYVSFWNDLDYIGIDAYFPLTDAENPTVEEIVASWSDAKNEIVEVVQKHPGKRVLFLEAGYKPRAFALKAPWEWQAQGEENQDIQANGYEGLMQVFWKEEWFAGLYWWKYFSDLESTAYEPTKEQFNPHLKKAEGVIKKYYQQ